MLHENNFITYGTLIFRNGKQILFWVNFHNIVMTQWIHTGTNTLYSDISGILIAHTNDGIQNIS